MLVSLLGTAGIALPYPDQNEHSVITTTYDFTINSDACGKHSL